jgi:methylamine dehydrogenase accessory protein MauD
MSQAFVVSYVVLWALVLALAMLLVLVYRHFGIMAMSTAEGHDRDGLPVGHVAPQISGVDRTNGRIHWSPEPGRHHLLFFAAPGCEPCEAIAPLIGALGRADEQDRRVVVVASGRGDEVLALDRLTGGGVLCLADDGSGVMQNYEVQVTPFAFLLDPDGRVVAKGNCSTPPRLRRLLAAGDLRAAASELDHIVARWEAPPPASRALNLSTVDGR